MIHTYLFYIDDGRVYSYKFASRTFTLIKYKGEDSCNANLPSFWEWWEECCSFIASEDCVDFCFLGNGAIADFYKKSYRPGGSSQWSFENIQVFLNQIIQGKVKLVHLLNSQVSNFGSVPQNYKHEPLKELTYFTVPANIVEDPGERGRESRNQGLRKYYLEQLDFKG